MKAQIILFVAVMLLSCQNQVEKEIQKYDQETQQSEILTKKGIDSVINSFAKISYQDIEKSYFSYTDPALEYDKKLNKMDYLIVQGKDVFKYVVGKYRVMNFLATDSLYTNNLDHLDENRKQYWLIDRNVIYMILEFILVLDEKGYDKYGFNVRESHRHPRLNELRGGATQSQHLFGCAVDLEIEDINKDGKVNAQDKDICLGILENIVSDKGGMGLYPGTQTIHIDCRGYKARWNNYKRPKK